MKTSFSRSVLVVSAVLFATGSVGSCSSNAVSPDAGTTVAPSSSNASVAASSSASTAAPVLPDGQSLASGSSSADAPDTGPPWFGLPPNRKDQVAKAINPKDEIPYSGKTGTIHGRITIKGDAPPAALGSDGKPLAYSDECAGASAVYEKLFRTGDKGTLGDALVAVTEYQGFVPAKDRAQHVRISKCAFSARTIAAAYGQRIEVSNKDAKLTYMPYLDGAPFRAMLAAIPEGKPIKLYPIEPGHYLIRDQLQRPFLIADVFVVPYATFDVTGVDGRYVIHDVPVGKAKIDAFLPVINKSVGHTIDVKEGDNTVDVELTFDQKKDTPVPVPPPVWGDRVHPPAPTSGSAAPATGGAPK